MKIKNILPSLLLLPATTLMAKQQQPNIVLFFVDDLGWADLGYENPVFDTPNINELKEEGTYFSRAYVSTATSSPSRASLLTGKDALRCGFVRHIYGNSNGRPYEKLATDPGHMKSRAWLPLEEITYAERLHEYNYYNYFVGKWHLGPEEYFPVQQGFDEMYGTTEHGHPASYYQPFFKDNNPLPDVGEDAYLTDVLTQGSVDFIKSYKKDQPFLLNISYYAVHGPHIGRKDLVKKYEERGLEGAYAQYAAQVEAVDESVGKVRDALKKRGVENNTIIIFTSDQGGAFKNGHLRGGKKGGDTLAEGGSRVPLIIYFPGMKAMGTTYSDPVMLFDIYPTLVELASGNPCKDNHIQGVSLLPVLRGNKINNRYLYMHRSYENQNAAIIDGDWKLIRYRDASIQLYNLKEDESETMNLKHKYPDIADKLEQRLKKWQNDNTPYEILP